MKRSSDGRCLDFIKTSDLRNPRASFEAIPANSFQIHGIELEPRDILVLGLGRPGDDCHSYNITLGG